MSICLSCIHAGHCESTIVSHPSWPVSAKIAYRTYGLSHLQWPVPHLAWAIRSGPILTHVAVPSNAYPIQSGLCLSPALAKTQARDATSPGSSVGLRLGIYPDQSSRSYCSFAALTKPNVRT
jgi:hypothetical protein